MNKTTKVAISLPSEMYQTLETARLKKGESRSEYFRHAIEILLKQEQDAKDLEAYTASYANDPETKAEVKAADRLSASILAEETW